MKHKVLTVRWHDKNGYASIKTNPEFFENADRVTQLDALRDAVFEVNNFYEHLLREYADENRPNGLQQ